MTQTNVNIEGPRVLVVEARKPILKRIVGELQTYGYKSDCAITYREALRKIQQNEYDVAVLDYQLADGEGDSLLPEIKAKTPECVCIMMSADDQSALAVKWLETGAAAYVRKPFAPEYLIAVCERARRERALFRTQDLLDVRTRQLRESEEHFRRLAESSQDLIFSVDRQGVFLTAGGIRLTQSDLRPEDIVQKSIYEIFPAEQADRYHKKLQEVFSSGQSITYENTFSYAGIARTDLTTVYPINSENGEVESAGVICRDITEEKRIYAALQESEALYQDLVEAQTDLICRWLPDTTLTFVNEAYCVYFNQTREELLGSSFAALLPAETVRDIQSSIEKVSEGTDSFFSEEMNYDSDGRERWVQWAYRVFRDERGNAMEFQSVGRDITERKLMEQSLRLQHSLSEQLNSARDIPEAMRLILATCLQLTSIDCGGAYVLNPDERNLNLIDHHGVSEEFKAACSTYPHDAPELSLVRERKIFYSKYEDFKPGADQPRRAEGLQAIAILPFVVGGEVTATINLASRTHEEFPDQVRLALETMVSQLTSVLERIQTKEKLESEATRRRILMEESRDGIVILDQDGRVYEANHSFAEMLGYPFEEVNHLSVFDWEFLHPRERVLEMIRDVDENGDHFETRHRRKDGSVIHVEISSNAARFDGQKLIFCICRDITERKRLEQEISLKSLVLDQIKDHVTVTDLQGNITYVNNAEIQTMGIPCEQLAGKTTRIYGEDAARGATQQEILENTLRDGFWRGEVVDFSADGKEHILDCRTQVIQDTEGRPLALCGIASDITERKLAEKALAESEKHLRSVLDGLSAHIAVLDESGEIILINKAYRDFGEQNDIKPGFLAEGANYLAVCDRASGDNSEEAIPFAGGIREVLSGRLPSFELEYPCHSPDEKRWFLGRVTPIQGEGPRRVIVAHENITKQKQAEEQRQEGFNLLTNLARLVPGVIYQYRLYPDGHSAFPYSSPGMYDIYAVTPEEVRDDAAVVFGRIHPEDHDRVAEAIFESARTLNTFECELRVILPGQGLRWRWSLAHPERTEDGGTLWYGIILDITDRKQAEEELRAKEENFSDIFQSVSEGICYADHHGKIITVNNALQKITGIPASNLNEKHVVDLAGRFLFGKNVIKAIPFLKDFLTGKAVQPIQIEINGKVVEVAAIRSAGSKRLIGILRDITERWQAEEALRISETRYRLAQAMGHVGNWEYNLQTTEFWGSDEAKRIYGFDLAQSNFSTDEVERCIPDRERVHQALVDLIEADKPYDLEFEIIPRNSSESRIIASIAKLERDEQGNPLKVMGVIQDITARRQADEALRKSESLFKKVFEILPIGLWIADKQGRLIQGNPAGVKIWGMEPKVAQSEYGIFKARRLPSGEEIAPEDWALAHTVNEGVTIGDEMLEIDAFDGMKKIILNYSAPILDSKGAVEGAVVVNQDITERRLAEEALLESEEKYRLLHEAAGVGIGYYTPEGIIISYNQIAARHMNGIPEDFEGKSIYQVFPKEEAEQFMQRIKKAAVTDGSREYEDRVDLPDGARWFHSIFTRVVDSTGKTIGIQIISNDIDKRKRAEEKSLQQLEELKRWQTITIGREERIMQLKRDINRLLDEAGKPPRFATAAGGGKQDTPGESPESEHDDRA